MIQAGLDLLKHFEGCVLTAYPDPGTGGDPWTLGYGFTDGVKPGDTMSQEEADARLAIEVASYEHSVRDMLQATTTEAQLSALVCIAYNIGRGALKTSTLLRKHNSLDYSGCAAEFPRWNRAGGRVMPGLARRREAERNLYLGRGFPS